MAGADRPRRVSAAAAPYEHVVGASGGDLPTEGILSRTVTKRDGVRVTWFGFAAGEEMSEHTASRPALLHVLRGRVRMTLGDQTAELGAGDFLRMEARLRHSLAAVEPVEFLLTLLPPVAEPVD